MLEKLKGKKTYLTMVIIIAFGTIGGWNEYCSGSDVVTFCKQIIVPDWIFAVLGTLGIYTRSQVGK